MVKIDTTSLWFDYGRCKVAREYEFYSDSPLLLQICQRYFQTNWGATTQINPIIEEEDLISGQIRTVLRIRDTRAVPTLLFKLDLFHDLHPTIGVAFTGAYDDTYEVYLWIKPNAPQQ